MKNTVYSWSNSLKRKKREGMLQENVMKILDGVDFEWECSKKKNKIPMKKTCDNVGKSDNAGLESNARKKSKMNMHWV